MGKWIFEMNYNSDPDYDAEETIGRIEAEVARFSDFKRSDNLVTFDHSEHALAFKMRFFENISKTHYC